MRLLASLCLIFPIYKGRTHFYEILCFGVQPKFVYTFPISVKIIWPLTDAVREDLYVSVSTKAAEKNETHILCQIDLLRP
jgi:hypothetical protein